MLQKPSPTVSVVMSVYNGMPHLVGAMESLTAQSYQDLEFVVVDDGSTDDSLAYLRAVAARDPRLRLVEQENTGLTKALIRGVAEARGEFIARMDADDISEPTRIERQAAALQAAPGAVAVTCGLLRFRDDGSATLQPPRGPPELTPWFLVFFNVVAGHGQVMFRKAAYEAAGGYDEAFRYSQDHDLWTRLLKLGEMAMQAEALYRYRDDHAASITTRHRPLQDDCSYRVSERAYEDLTGQPIARSTAERLRYFWVFRHGFELDNRGSREVERALRRAFDAYFSTWPKYKTRRAELRWLIAERWIMAAKVIGIGNAPLLLACCARALSWSPSLAIQRLLPIVGAAVLKRRSRQSTPVAS